MVGNPLPVKASFRAVLERIKITLDANIFPRETHTTPVRHMQTIPSEWMDGMLAPDRPPLPGRGRRGGRSAVGL